MSHFHEFSIDRNCAMSYLIQNSCKIVISCPWFNISRLLIAAVIYLANPALFPTRIPTRISIGILQEDSIRIFHELIWTMVRFDCKHFTPDKKELWMPKAIIIAQKTKLSTS